MAIATLDKVYNNGDVFTGVVKIRKGTTCQLILASKDMEQVKACFRRLALSIASRVDPSDPTAATTLSLCDQIVSLCGGAGGRLLDTRAGLSVTALAPVVLGYCAYNLSVVKRGVQGTDRAQSNTRLLWAGLVLSLAALGGSSLSIFLGPSRRSRPPARLK